MEPTKHHQQIRVEVGRQAHVDQEKLLSGTDDCRPRVDNRKWLPGWNGSPFPRAVEKQRPTPYCKIQYERRCGQLPSPKTVAQHLTRTKEIGRWKPSRRSRIFKILSSIPPARSGTISRFTWSAALN